MVVSSLFGPRQVIPNDMLDTFEPKSIAARTEFSSMRARERKAMNPAAKVVQETHEFTLIYTGVEDLTDEFVNAMYEAGCDDALIGMRDGYFFADFGRSAPTFREALISAIEDIERSGQPLRLVRVEPL
jgi:hypothetical protein